MNRILFEKDEIVDGVVTFGGTRAEHVLSVLHGEVGQILKTGEVNGPIGTGEIVGIQLGIRNGELGIRNEGRLDSVEGESDSAIPNSSFVIRNSTDEDLIVGFAVLCHDFGKPLCTRYDPVAKRIRSRGHDEEGVGPTLSFLRRLTNEERILREVPPLVRLHMRPFAMWRDRSGDGAIRRLAAQVVRIDRLLRVAAADDAGRPPFPRQPEHLSWLAEQAERLAIADAAPKPIVQGRDLIALGLRPGPEFGRLLAVCFDAQLDGAFADLAGGICYLKSHLL